MITHKRGDSFQYLAEIPAAMADGYFSGWSVAAQVRTTPNGKLLADLSCTWSDPVTTRVLMVQAMDTSHWDVGSAEMDIQFTRKSDGFVRSTATESIQVKKDVTQVI